MPFNPSTARLAPTKSTRFDPATATLSPEPANRSLTEVATDLGSSFGAGANILVKMAGDLYGLASGDMENALSQQGQRGIDYWNQRKSPQLLHMEQGRKAKIDAADGELAKAGTAFWETVKSPSLFTSFLVEQVPMLLPIAGVGRGAGIATKAAGARGVVDAGRYSAQKAALIELNKTAGKVATGAAVGTGAAMQGADAGSQAYEQLIALPEPIWDQNDQFRSLTAGGMSRQQAKQSLAADLSKNAAIASGVASVGLNLLPGARILEKSLAGVKLPGSSRAMNALKGFLGESAQEGLEEGSGAFLANRATRAVDPSQDLMTGVGEATGMGAAFGPFGAVAGAMNSRASESINDVITNVMDPNKSLDESLAAAEDLINVSARNNIDEEIGSMFEDAADMRQYVPGYVDFERSLGLDFEAEGNYNSLTKQSPIDGINMPIPALDATLETTLEAEKRTGRYSDGLDYAPAVSPKPGFSTEPVSRLGEFTDNGIEFEPDPTFKRDQLAAGVEAEIQRYKSKFPEEQNAPDFRAEEARIKKEGNTRELKDAIRALGGINLEQARAEGVLDKNQRQGFGWLGTKNGKSFDAMRESLAQEGFDFPTANDLVDALTESVNGHREHYAPAGIDLRQLYEYKQQEEVEKQRFDAGEWTLAAKETDYHPESVAHENLIADEAQKALDAGMTPEMVRSILDEHEKSGDDWGAIWTFRGAAYAANETNSEGQAVQGRDGTEKPKAVANEAEAAIDQGSQSRESRAEGLRALGFTEEEIAQELDNETTESDEFKSYREWVEASFRKIQNTPVQYNPKRKFAPQAKIRQDLAALSDKLRAAGFRVSGMSPTMPSEEQIRAAFDKESKFALAQPTEQSLQAQSDTQAAAQAKNAAAEQKAEADSKVSDFTLAGSDSPVDQAEARGQKNLFDAKPSSIEDSAYHYTKGNLGMTSSGSFTSDRSRWTAFTPEDAERMSGGSIKPYGATKNGLFVGIESGKAIKPAVANQPATTNKSDSVAITPLEKSTPLSLPQSPASVVGKVTSDQPVATQSEPDLVDDLDLTERTRADIAGESPERASLIILRNWLDAATDVMNDAQMPLEIAGDAIELGKRIDTALKSGNDLSEIQQDVLENVEEWLKRPDMDELALELDPLGKTIHSQQALPKKQEKLPAPEKSELAEVTDALKDLTATLKKQVETPASKIEDFGKKIGGARKDAWGAYADQLGKASSDIGAQPLSKTWPEPDYQALIDGGADPWSVAFMRAARDEIPTKPKSEWKLKRWVEKVQLLRDAAMKVVDGEFSADRAKDLMKDFRRLDGFADKVDLYVEVGHQKSLKGVSITVGSYSMYKGVEYKPAKTLWSVSKRAKATAFSNWPTELAMGSTKEEAIANFKKNYDSIEFDKPASKEVKFSIYSKRGENGFFIGKKLGRNYIDLEKFDTVTEAREYLRENNAALVAKLEERKVIPAVRPDTNNPRVGEDMRQQQDVTPEMFSNAFGFRGVEFGNWVENTKRQQDLNNAYDALMDMAAILEIPPKAISLNGELGLAFGARGAGGVDPASAHYEPGFVVINLTKKEGAGSLGHEWWHALDNYFSRSRDQRDDYMTEALDVSLSSRNSDYLHRGSVRKEMVDAFGSVVRAINSTAIKARAAKLDAKRSKDYWVTGREMSARAFESYLISKLQDQNASNDYLANIIDPETWKAAESLGWELEESYPYPTAGEIPAIRAAFDELFQIVESKETDAGTALFYGSENKIPKGIGAKSVREAIADTILSWQSGPQVTVVDTAADLPPGLRMEAEEFKGEVSGLIDPSNGDVYLVGDKIRNAEHAQRVLAHEVVGHFAFDREFADQLRDIYNKVDFLSTKNEKIKAIVDEVERTYRDRPRVDRSAEVIARIAEQKINHPVLVKVYAAIRNFLRSLGFNIQFSRADLDAMIVTAANSLRRKRASQGGQEFQGASFSVEESSVYGYKNVGGKWVNDLDGDPATVEDVEAAIDEQVNEIIVQIDNQRENAALHAKEALPQLQYAKANGIQVNDVLLKKIEKAAAKHTGPDKSAVEKALWGVGAKRERVLEITEKALAIYDHQVANLIDSLIPDARPGQPSLLGAWFKFTEGLPEQERIDRDLQGAETKDELIEEYRKEVTEYLGDSLGQKVTLDDLVKYLGAFNGRAATFLNEIAESKTEMAFQARTVLQAIERGQAMFNAESSQTDTPAFKEWFGESKVVDENGDPLVVYRTGSFDPADDPIPVTDAGMHFGTRQAAEERVWGKFQEDTVANAEVYEENGRFYLDENEWVNASSAGFPDEDAARNWLAGEVAGMDMDPEYDPATTAVYLSIQNPKRVPDQGRAWEEAIAQAKAEGYDGLVYNNRVEHKGKDSYVAFYPEQIKSATGNRGTFDSNNPNILFSAETDTWAEDNRRLREEDKTLWERGKKMLRRQFSPGGLLPQAVFDLKIERDNEFAVVEFEASHLVGELERAIEKDYGKPFIKLSENDKNTLSEGLAGKFPDSLKENSRVALMAMRQKLDIQSKQYIVMLGQEAQDLVRQAEITGEGMAEAEQKMQLMEIIAGNLGRYVHRSYRAFDDKSWHKKVPDSVLNDARAYLMGGLRKSGMTETQARDRAGVIMDDLLKNGTAYEGFTGFIKETKLGAKDLSVLKKRKDIAPEIRALLGEYNDPRLNFAKSTTKMGRLIWNQSFLSKLREIGTGEFLFTEDDRPQGTVKIAAEGSEVYAPLNGLYTFREIDQALKDALGKENMANWYRYIVQANGIVKFGKTVLSPTTAARNWQSALFFTIANGHFDLRHTAKSIAGIGEYFNHKGSPEKLEYLKKLKRLGVVYDTPYAGEMMRLLDDSQLENMLTGSKFGDLGRDFLKFAQKTYSYGDDWWKIIGFENEKQSLMKAGFKESDAEVEAAKRIRDTYPTYSMVGRGVQSLRRFPLAGTFVSFPAEIIRTTFNMLNYMASDMKDPKLRPLAIRRAAGMSIAAGFAAALQAASKAMFDIDDDDEEAVRLQAAPWNENSNLIFTGRDEKGNMRYIDISFVDPYNYWKRPINAILRDQPWRDAAVDIAREALAPFLGVDIAAGAIGEVLANKRMDTGTEVYKEHDLPHRKLNDIANHLRKNLQPGLAANLERTWKALKGEVSGSGQQYNLTDEGLAWVGWRVSTLDPKTALYYRTFDFQDAKSDATRTLREVLTSPNDVSQSAIERNYSLASSMHQKAYEDMFKLVGAAQRSGMTRSQIMRTLKSSGVSQKDIAALLNNRVPRLLLSSQSQMTAVRSARERLGADRAKAISERYQEARKLSLQ